MADDQDNQLNDLARMAYDQYAIVTGGKNYQGLPMPKYVDLGPTIQSAWRTAVGAVVRATTMSPDSVQHPCQLEKKRDEAAYVEQYIQRCRCHEERWHITRPGDEMYCCPVTGTSAAS